MLFRTQDDPELRCYLLEKQRQARWVLDALAQRRTTLLRCAEQITAAQQAFFLTPGAPLAPLRMAQTAEALGVNESTVSRAVKGKYLQCERGTFPLSAFFSRKLPCGGSGASAMIWALYSARTLLTALVAAEDRRAPLSDQQLAELLTARGCPISRRTVAKYRTGLGIPSTLERREI